MKGETMKGSESEWCKRNGVNAGQTLLATPAAAPNVILGIDPVAALRLTSWQLERERRATCSCLRTSLAR